MLTSASSEFIALCRSQVALLTQGSGAALSVVYLTEDLVEGDSSPGLIPVVAYPETTAVWGRPNTWMPILQAASSEATPQLIQGVSPEGTVALPNQLGYLKRTATERDWIEDLNCPLLPSTQIVLPLIHEGVVLGLLVTGREDRAWNSLERSEIERIAQTLTLARLLDRRREWFEQELSQQQRLRVKQRDLLNNVLHQFRNSLMALRTFGKLLIKRLLPGDSNREVAANLVRESDRLQDLLHQFDRAIDLTIEDLEPKKLLPPLLMEARVQPVPLLPDVGIQTSCLVAELMESLLATARAIALERNLEIQTVIPPNLPPVRADAKALREVLSNLIDNALKYTPSGGKVYIEVTQQDRQRISISDTGLGIPAADLEHVFERHYRGVQAESEIPGTGLGLAIAKELVEQMQGEIEVDSPSLHVFDSALGPGSTFSIWLPSS